MINTPNRVKPDAKYVVTAPYCHWTWERNITVLALLVYTTQNTHVTRNVVKSAIKEAPTEEALHQRIAEQECYTELVKTILSAITDISEVENRSVVYKEKAEMINGVIEFIREKGMKPSCKLLPEETIFTDFTTAAEDTTTMDSARDIVNTKMPADEIVKQWRNQHDSEIRSRNKRILRKKCGEDTSYHQGT